MFNEFKNKLKITKWEWIPIIGTIIYSVRIEFFMNMNFGRSKLRKAVRKYRGIWNTITTLITLSFSITGFVLKYGYHYGGFPWPFIVAIVIGLIINFSVFIPYLLFKKGLDDVLKKSEQEQQVMLQEAEMKRLALVNPKKKKDE